jgi:hypothetical protein
VNAHRSMEAKANRRRKRLATESRWRTNRRQRRLAARVERGSALMLLAITPGARAKGSVRPGLAPFPCDCDPARAHGPHWRRVADEEQRLTLIDKFWKAVSR